ncbi:MAG: PA2169 family four-helix-bundle protein [Mucilaginibacter sp.]
METTEKSIDVLNDLIEINNDRVAGFEKAAKDLGEGDFDLKGIFGQYAQESRIYSTELSSAVIALGGEAERGTGMGGDIHRAWIDVKATFTGHDRKSVLAECERGEDAIKKAYQSALDPENELSFDVTDMIRRQQQGIEAAHDRIKALRDSAA